MNLRCLRSGTFEDKMFEDGIDRVPLRLPSGPSSPALTLHIRALAENPPRAGLRDPGRGPRPPQRRVESGPHCPAHDRVARSGTWK